MATITSPIEKGLWPKCLIVASRVGVSGQIGAIADLELLAATIAASQH